MRRAILGIAALAALGALVFGGQGDLPQPRIAGGARHEMPASNCPDFADASIVEGPVDRQAEAPAIPQTADAQVLQSAIGPELTTTREKPARPRPRPAPQRQQPPARVESSPSGPETVEADDEDARASSARAWEAIPPR